MRLFGRDAPERSEIKTILEQIESSCEDRGFELKKVASGYRFQVRSELSEWIGRLWDEKPPRYSRALLETLSLIAYRQPITRGDIEEIRGVSVSTNIVRSLMEREWIRIVGHRDVPGRPAIFATTKTFLDYFNLKSLEELPPLAEIRDLGRINEELNLVDEAPGAANLTLDSEGGIAGEAEPAVDENPENIWNERESVLADDKLFDEDLKDVSEKVDQIQQNISAFVHEDMDEEEDESEESWLASDADREAADQVSDDSGEEQNSPDAPEPAAE